MMIHHSAHPNPLRMVATPPSTNFPTSTIHTIGITTDNTKDSKGTEQSSPPQTTSHIQRGNDYWFNPLEIERITSDLLINANAALIELAQDFISTAKTYLSFFLSFFFLSFFFLSFFFLSFFFLSLFLLSFFFLFLLLFLFLFLFLSISITVSLSVSFCFFLFLYLILFISLSD
jgi:hypothetical protein